MEDMSECGCPHLQKLAGSLSKVADDAFQGLPFSLVGNRIQVHSTWGGGATGGETETRSRTLRESPFHFLSPS